MSRKELIGTVVQDKMSKSRVVQVESLVCHPKYKKHLIRHKKMVAHDEANKTHVGDKVIIRESRPLSKTKTWVIQKLLAPSKLQKDS